MDLVRKIVFAIEAQEHGFLRDELQIEGYTEEQVGYHVYLMMQAGLVEAAETTCLGSQSPEAQANGLTWAGHEFAEAARDEGRCTKAMTIVREQGGSVTIGVLQSLLTNLMARALGLAEG
jgi:hypothetical protein